MWLEDIDEIDHSHDFLVLASRGGLRDLGAEQPVKLAARLLEKKAETIIRQEPLPAVLDHAAAIKSNLFRGILHPLDRFRTHCAGTSEDAVDRGDADAGGLGKIGNGWSLHDIFCSILG
ncbi:hypothetical protein FHX10_002379 [Rhizobium sp. BK591]|nr:hypothetical protein [Rhizobium sp. BK591]